MSAREFRCDQAIFTSVRSPMGEGYRIVAASRGLKAEEKQHITRYSPSHEALWPGSGWAELEGRPLAVSFYALPTGRLCVACSCYAGAEHTGRGGQRVYTISVVFDADELAAWGFNPFEIVRAMSAAGLLTPQLKPQALLDEVRLFAVERAFQGGNEQGRDVRGETAPTGVLERLLDNRSTVLNTASDPLPTAEWILAGVPGPLRASMPFSAGVRFSVGRTHRWQVVFDEKHACRDKLRGKQIEYVDALADRAPTSRSKVAAFMKHAPPTVDIAQARPQPTASPSSAWLAMVERCWSAKELSTLLTRTSKAYQDTSPPARERVGRLYRDVDSVASLPPAAILDLVEANLANDRSGVEGEIVDELVNISQQALSKHVSALSVDGLRATVRRLSAIALRGHRGAAFAGRPIHDTLQAIARQDITNAAEALLELRSSSVWTRVSNAKTMVVEVVSTISESLAHVAPADLDLSTSDSNGATPDPGRLKALLLRLATAFPNEPAVRLCLQHVDRLASTPMPAPVD